MMASSDVELWQMISWSAQNIHQLRLVHFESWSLREPSRSGLWSGVEGRSVWGGMCMHGLVGISWPWAQLSPGVLVLTDPLAVRSNLLLLGSDGSRLGPSAAAMVHNRIVADLEWQREAAKALTPARPRRIDAVQVRAVAGARPC